MAYGLHPQLYPYLYAPKNPLTLQQNYESQEHVQASRHKTSRDRDEGDDKTTHDDTSSGKGDEDCAIDESENVEID